MTQNANFDFFYFVLILYLILGKVKKFPVVKLFTSEVISKKHHGGGVGKHPLPSAFRVNPNLALRSNFSHVPAYLKPRSNDPNFLPNNTQHLCIICCMLLHVVVLDSGQTHQTFCATLYNFIIFCGLSD